MLSSDLCPFYHIEIMKRAYECMNTERCYITVEAPFINDIMLQCFPIAKAVRLNADERKKNELCIQHAGLDSWPGLNKWNNNA